MYYVALSTRSDGITSFLYTKFRDFLILNSGKEFFFLCLIQEAPNDEVGNAEMDFILLYLNVDIHKIYNMAFEHKSSSSL